MSLEISWLLLILLKSEVSLERRFDHLTCPGSVRGANQELPLAHVADGHGVGAALATPYGGCDSAALDHRPHHLGLGDRGFVDDDEIGHALPSFPLWRKLLHKRFIAVGTDGEAGPVLGVAAWAVHGIIVWPVNRRGMKPANNAETTQTDYSSALPAPVELNGPLDLT